ncbi:MAG TPA: hypothetical protein VFX48_05905, partial [Saprospiraceae bacterium]|nr:hypothetical protein [Saprospiraceae bacterium]
MNRFILFASLLACCGFSRLNAQCNLTVDAGPDLKVCNVGDMIMINGKVTGNIQEIFWEPSTGLSNPRSPVTKATVSGNQEYILTARGLSAQNLILNGNFEAGRTGFYTDYILGFMSCYGAGYLDCEGTYDVINNPQNGHTGFAPCGDHTSGSGLMMVLNGAAAFQNVWCQNVPVMPDMDYVFTAWVTSVVGASPPILQFSINGNPIGPNFTSSGAVCTWEKYEVIWNSGSNTSAQICILNENTATGGNDFAIDDIGFRKICEVKDTMMIEVEEIVIDIEEPEFMTCDNPMIKLHAKGSSGGPGWTYRWTTSDGKIISGGNTPEPTIKGPGTYYFTICSPLPNCCQTQSIEVMGNITPPELFMTVKDTLGCNRLSVTINTRSNRFPLDYEWSGPNGFNAQDPLVVVTEAGTYVLTITDEYNCKTIDSVTVFERIDNPRISIRANQINCKEDTAKLIGSSSVSGSVFEWTGPNNQFKKDSLWEVVDSGLYVLKVISPSGCIKWDSVRISKDDLSPQLQYASDTIRCSQDSASIRVTSNRRITRSDWQSMHGFLQIDSLHIRTNVPGSYQLLVEADNGCLDSLTIQVVADTLHPVLNPSADTLNCLSDSVVLISQSSDPNAMIFWTGPNGFQSSKDSTFTKIPGPYTAVALSSNGCSDTTLLFVAADTIRPQLSGGNDTLTCTKSSVQLNLTDPLASQYDWAGPNGFNSRLKNPVTAIPGNYSVTASLPNGCSTSLTLVIAIDTIRPKLSVQDDTLTCRFDSIQLQAAIQPASAKLMWTGPNNFQSDEQNPYVQLPGNYHLSVTGENGCADSASLQIFQDIRKPGLSIQTDTLNCVKRTATLRVASSIQPVQFNWSGPGGFSDTSSTIIVNRSGTFIITATTPELCITTQSVEVWEDTIRPDLQLFADSLNCLVREITLRTLSNADLRQFEWSGSGNFNSMLREPLIQNGGTYQLKVTAANQCTAVQSIQVHQDTIAP